jgi:electron transport complex protein RnfE
MKKSNILTNGLLKNNPVFRLVLGTCPTLAVSTMAINGIAMGLAATFVLICSNMLVSALRKVIPDKVRIPAFVLIIATFVTVVEMVMRKFLPDLYAEMGLFIALIVVNCIILARAEAFASTNTVLDSALDGLGMGLGFTLSLTLIGIVRELLGQGKFFGIAVPFVKEFAMSVFVIPAGGFLVFGLLMAAFNHIYAKAEERKNNKKPELTDEESMAVAIEEVKA